MIRQATKLGDIERKRRVSTNTSERSQELCEYCGSGIPKSGHECQLTAEHKAALREFAARYGAIWKTALRRSAAHNRSQALSEALEIIGPGGLYLIRVRAYWYGEGK